MGRRFVAGGAVGAALVLSLTGCLGESKSGNSGSPAGAVQLTAAQILQKTSEKTGQAQSFSADIAFQGTDEGEPMKMSGDMRYQTQPLAFSFNFTDISSAGQSMPGGMEMLFVDGTLYMKVPVLTQITGGKPWMKFSKRDLAKGGADLKELTQQSDQFNMQVMTKMLTLSKDAKVVGKENIEGVQATHYTGTTGDKDALATLTPEERKQAKEFFDTGEKAAFDVWIEDQQLPRKIVLKSVPGAKEKQAMTMVFHDYGKPMNITAPPAEQVGRPSKQLLTG